MKKRTILALLGAFAVLATATTSCSKDKPEPKPTPPPPVKSISLASQSGTLTSGTAGSVTFAATTANIADGKSGSVAWFTSVEGTTTGSAPAGVTASVSNVASNKATVTVNTTTAAAQGSYYFKLTIDGTTSAVATLAVGIVPLAFTHNASYDIPATKVGTAIANIDVSGGVSGGKTPYTFSATGLPAGITIASSTGIISGTPTAAAAAATATVTVKDASSPSQSKDITIALGTITEPKTVAVGAQSGSVTTTVGGAVTFPVTTEGITAGTYPATVANLPTGLTAASVIINGSGEGTLTLTAEASAAAGNYTTLTLTLDGATSAAFTLTIGAVVKVTSLSLNKTSLSLTVGASEKLTVTVNPSDATNKEVSWHTGNELRFTVSADGTVKGVGTGSAQLIVRSVEDPSIYATCTVNVSGELVGQFKVGDIYYKAISTGSTNVKVTNKAYLDGSFTGVENSYSGAVTVPATVEYEGVTYTVTQVGDRAFYMSASLTSVALPVGIATIGDYAFAECPLLASVNLPEGVETIGAWAFRECPTLTTLHIPASLTGIGGAGNPVFAGSTSLELTAAAGGWFSVVDGVLFSTDGSNAVYALMWLPEKKTGTYAIPDGVAMIDIHAINSSKLTSIAIPASVTNLVSHNFHGSTNLVEVTLNWADPTVCWTNPNPATFYFRDGKPLADITVKVPAGTKAKYLAHPLWGMGFNIVEMP